MLLDDEKDIKTMWDSKFLKPQFQHAGRDIMLLIERLEEARRHALLFYDEWFLGCFRECDDCKAQERCVAARKYMDKLEGRDGN